MPGDVVGHGAYGPPWNTEFGDKTDGAEVVEKFKSSVKDKTNKSSQVYHYIVATAFLILQNDACRLRPQIGDPHDPKSTADHPVPITGVGPNGLGETQALLLAGQNPARLIITGRSLDKVGASAKTIRNAHPSVEVSTKELDLALLHSVKEAAKEVQKSYGNIDILINNAGVMDIPERILSIEGYEMHLATNHLGPFAFTNLILPTLLASPHHPRIVNIVSNGYALSPFRFSNPNFDNKTAIPESEQPPKEACQAFGRCRGRWLKRYFRGWRRRIEDVAA
ncbi:MAG: hypothetical protein Q9218_002751 [Villophora microphyllina]